jgi:hypothetical protein
MNGRRCCGQHYRRNRSLQRFPYDFPTAQLNTNAADFLFVAIPGDCVECQTKRIYEWLDKSCTFRSRQPLSVLKNYRPSTSDSDPETQQVTKTAKRKIALHFDSAMAQTPSFKKRIVTAGSEESRLARGECAKSTRCILLTL